MTTWDHRLIELEGGRVLLCEVYYASDGTPLARTENAMSVEGDYREDAQQVYLQMASAFLKPTLHDSVFEVDHA